MPRALAALAVLLAASGSAAAAHPNSGPNPNELVGMFIGDVATNGSATIVTDRTGTHPDGFTGMAIVNPIAAGPPREKRHRHEDPAKPTKS